MYYLLFLLFLMARLSLAITLISMKTCLCFVTSLICLGGLALIYFEFEQFEFHLIEKYFQIIQQTWNK